VQKLRQARPVPTYRENPAARAPSCLAAKPAHFRTPEARSSDCVPGWPPRLAKVWPCQAPICARIFRENFIYRPKWLIDKGFKNDPKFLWITLLTACQTASETPIYQGFGHNARKFGNRGILSKSSTYKKTKPMYIFFRV
jgi:hypothetical protein